MNNPYFMHYRNMRNPERGGVTVCIGQLPDGGYRVVMATCSPRDNFNRRTGRTIALTRFNSEKAHHHDFPEKPPEALIRDLAMTRWAHSWERNVDTEALPPMKFDGHAGTVRVPALVLMARREPTNG